jgi:hypothetical protein
MNYQDILQTKIKFIITNDLTIGRLDNDLLPFASDQIDKFIKENSDNIEKVISIMIDEYSNDDELELLANPELDWIGEYLYDFVDTENSV